MARPTLPPTDAEPDPPPGVLRWLISCDESGVDGSPYYGFGTLWMKWQRRGEFYALVRALRERHGYNHEIKWKNVSARFLPFYRDLVDLFFEETWLCFHCIVVRKATVKKELHDGSIDLARRKHFTMLLTNKIKRSLKANPHREQTFRIWVDPIASSYKKADEAVEVIANNVLRKVFGERRPVDKVITCDSRERESIQLCDLLLGAVVGAWRQDATASAKVALSGHIAEHLGWTDLHADTLTTERKFNIWYFHDPTSPGPRDAKTRRVKLLHPLP